MALVTLNLQVDEPRSDFLAITAGIQKLVVDTPMTASLRELTLEGMGLSSLPECLRPLRLTSLSLNTNFTLTDLPEWLGDMPLVTLSLVNTGIAKLPQSFNLNFTLRCIDLMYSEICRSDMTTTENVETIHRELRPLSRNQPAIRFRLAFGGKRESGDLGSASEWDGWWSAESEPALLTDFVWYH